MMSQYLKRTVIILLALLAFVPFPVLADDGQVVDDLVDELDISFGTALSANNEVPFWIWNNKNGVIPADKGATGFTRLKFSRSPDADKEFDWGYGVDVTARSTGDSDIVWTDAYMGAEFKSIRMTLGRKSEFFGLADTLLSIGPEAFTRNAPTIPKIAIATKDYVGVTDWLAFNAYLGHGWFGEDQYVPNAYFFQNFLYLKVGGREPDHGVNFYAGIHRLAEWGGVGQPSSFNDFLRILFGQNGGDDATKSDQDNALGNQLGTIEYALQLKGQERDWYLYMQTMYEDGSGLRFWFPSDYLLGLSLIEKHSSLKRVNIEYMDTRDGGNNPNEPDNYFYNGTYSGWVHEGWGIGHPFIRFTEGANNAYYPDNRIQGANASAMFAYSELFNPLLRLAWMRNEGSFSRPLEGDAITTLVALDFSNTMYFDKGWSLTQQVSLDTGHGTTTTPGVFLMLTKSWF